MERCHGASVNCAASAGATLPARSRIVSSSTASVPRPRAFGATRTSTARSPSLVIVTGTFVGPIRAAAVMPRMGSSNSKRMGSCSQIWVASAGAIDTSCGAVVSGAGLSGGASGIASASASGGAESTGDASLEAGASESQLTSASAHATTRRGILRRPRKPHAYRPA
jgi:hypothetical protein